MGMYDLGEIYSLCQLAHPNVGLVTNVGPTHLERLGSIERIAQAKRELVEALPANGIAILNADDPRVLSMAQHTQAEVFTYGLSEQATLRAEEISSHGLNGIQFVLHYQGEALHVKVPLLGRHSVHTALAATAIGLSQGLHWDEIVPGLQDAKAQVRLIAVPGPNNSLILDDTYNANADSSIAALNLLQELEAQRKIAVLGDMAELGTFEEEGHRKVGRRAAEVIDLLVTVGPKSKLIAEEAIAAGLQADHGICLTDTQSALTYLKTIIQTGDTVLIKGSRSLAMESIVSSLQTTAQAICTKTD
jgi:UDP-N-acetylmuramoyl-tripeptide--D-alanyl-D-alanine ligase